MAPWHASFTCLGERSGNGSKADVEGEMNVDFVTFAEVEIW